MSKTVFVFFDIGDTLASPVFSAAGRVEELDVYPFVTDILQSLNDARSPEGARIKLGLISNTPGESAASMHGLLAAAGLLASFESTLLLFSSVEGLNKSERRFLSWPARGLPPPRRNACSSARMKRSEEWPPPHTFTFLRTRSTSSTY